MKAIKYELNGKEQELLTRLEIEEENIKNQDSEDRKSKPLYSSETDLREIVFLMTVKNRIHKEAFNKSSSLYSMLRSKVENSALLDTTDMSNIEKKAYFHLLCTFDLSKAFMLEEDIVNHSLYEVYFGTNERNCYIDFKNDKTRSDKRIIPFENVIELFSNYTEDFKVKEKWVNKKFGSLTLKRLELLTKAPHLMKYLTKPKMSYKTFISKNAYDGLTSIYRDKNKETLDLIQNEVAFEKIRELLFENTERFRTAIEKNELNKYGQYTLNYVRYMNNNRLKTLSKEEMKESISNLFNSLEYINRQAEINIVGKNNKVKIEELMSNLFVKKEWQEALKESEMKVNSNKAIMTASVLDGDSQVEGDIFEYNNLLKEKGLSGLKLKNIPDNSFKTKSELSNFVIDKEVQNSNECLDLIKNSGINYFNSNQYLYVEDLFKQLPEHFIQLLKTKYAKHSGDFLTHRWSQQECQFLAEILSYVDNDYKLSKDSEDMLELMYGI
tara:strand:- start:16702 stop:18192 length:1491 start_codon:yes stop_codon:yes gene_type:complete